MERTVTAPIFLGMMCVGGDQQDICAYSVPSDFMLHNFLKDTLNLPDGAQVTVELSRRLSGSAFTTLLALISSYRDSKQFGFMLDQLYSTPASRLKSLLGRSNCGKTTEVLENAHIELANTKVIVSYVLGGEKLTYKEEPILQEYHNGKLSILDGQTLQSSNSARINRERNWLFRFSQTFNELLSFSDEKGVIPHSKFNLSDLTKVRSHSLQLPLEAMFKASARPNKAALPKSIKRVLELLGVKQATQRPSQLDKLATRIKAAIKKSATLNLEASSDKTYTGFIYQRISMSIQSIKDRISHAFPDFSNAALMPYKLTLAMLRQRIRHPFSEISIGQQCFDENSWPTAIEGDLLAPDHPI